LSASVVWAKELPAIKAAIIKKRKALNFMSFFLWQSNGRIKVGKLINS
jgi:hypothetical protein